MKYVYFFTAAFLSVATLSHAAEVDIPPGSCDPINAALASFDQSGGTIRLAEGTYTCATPVDIKIDNVSLVGAGSGKTLLKAADGKAMPVIVIGDVDPVPMQTKKWGQQYYPKTPVKNIELSGVSVDGNRHSTSMDFQGDNECYDFTKNISENCSVAPNMLVRNNGITIRRASNVQVHDVSATGNYSGGIVTEKKCANLVIDGFQSTDNFYDGFAGYETKNSVFRNGSISQNAYSGISVDLGFEHNTFESCDLSNNGDNGVFSANVGFNTYSNLTINNNKNYAIYIDGTSKQLPDGSWQELPNTCDGNIMKDSSFSGDGHGIRLNGICKESQATNLKIAADADCKYYAPGAQVAETNVQCLNPPSSDANAAKAP